LNNTIHFINYNDDNLKMNKISVAVPTYNSSKYLKSCISPFLDSNFADEVIVSDDCSDLKEFRKIKKIISKLNRTHKDKIQLFRNEKNLGGFENKFRSIKRCKNNIVYQIDSDNIPDKKSLNYLNTSIKKDFQQNTLYIPGSLKLFKKGKVNISKNIIDKIVIVQNDTLINKKNIQSNIPVSNITSKDMDFVLNLGNWLFDKNTYLNNCKKGLNEDFASADAVAVSYFWLTNNCEIKILSNLSHYHRLRPDSYYVTHKDKADKKVIDLLGKLKNQK